MPWINLTLRRGALPKPVQHAITTSLTQLLLWWEKPLVTQLLPETAASPNTMF